MSKERHKIIKFLNRGIDRCTIHTILIVTLVLYSFRIVSSLSILNAEQMGSSPDTGGAQSILVKTYNTLVSKGSTYGSSSSPDWTSDWGTYWNRIMYSASWEPDGTATSSDVLSGKSFYSGTNNRTIQTGTASSFGVDYSSQQYVVFNDGEAGDYEGEESTWTNTNALSGSEVWYDTRTGLYWARSEPNTLTNNFTISTCDFYTSEPRGTYDGSDSDCGNAINACGTLSLASTQGESNDTDWYLPTQKEFVNAYVNGLYNQTNAAFAGGTTSYWTSTETTWASSNAWRIQFYLGYTSYWSKSITNSFIRCVRRD